MPIGGKFETEAILIKQELIEFNNEQGEKIEYYEKVFLIGNEETDEPETITLRSKQPAITEELTFSEMLKGELITGTLRYEWRYNQKSKSYKPKYLEFLV